jgi:hypothetical protein
MSSLLATSSPYVSSSSSKEQDTVRDAGYRPCLYSVQGDLICGSKQDVTTSLKHRVDEGKLQMLEATIGVQDPFGINTSSRYSTYDGLNLHEAIDGKKMKEPCCRCKCGNVGPCNDPMAIVKEPTSTCALCQTGHCNRKC